MSLYLLESGDRSVQVYARYPFHIEDLMGHAKKMAEKGKLIDHKPNDFVWVKDMRPIESIAKINHGRMLFQSGIATTEDPEWKALPVTKDFVLYVHEDSLRHLGGAQKVPMEDRLVGDDLYEFVVPSNLCPARTFVPKDVMDAIRRYPLN